MSSGRAEPLDRVPLPASEPHPDHHHRVGENDREGHEAQHGDVRHTDRPGTGDVEREHRQRSHQQNTEQESPPPNAKSEEGESTSEQAQSGPDETESERGRRPQGLEEDAGEADSIERKDANGKGDFGLPTFRERGSGLCDGCHAIPLFNTEHFLYLSLQYLRILVKRELDKVC